MANINWKDLEYKLNNKWGAISRNASLHPKSAIGISLVIGAVIGWFLHALFN